MESDVFYVAILEIGNTLLFNKNFWNGKRSVFSDICPGMEELCDIIRVYETDGLMLYADIKNQIALCGNI
ncbi:MAG: hypothetical protein BWY15_01613 [Firmicutes bacterium ADurb.Bin193]|nr:MAG: hypothetical protein BWY15_01613 [Firmicutes bacterium ADurb.Bin193]